MDNDSLFYTRTQEPYVELLKKEEWRIRRDQIIARDRSTCSNCGKTGKEVPLEVHHKCYVEGLDPWEYPDEALITLCSDCHHKWHQENLIRYAEKHDDGWYWVRKTPCLRCQGVGYLREYHYYYNGICFRCWGERFEGGGERIKLFTEQKGKTPQEYFDVFAPLTDEEVARIYAERHPEINAIRVSYLLLAHTIKESDFLKVALVGNTGEIYYAALDSALIKTLDEESLNQTNCLNVKTILFKECMSQNYQRYIVVKGDFIPYTRAKEMEKEIKAAHESPTQ